MSEQTNTAAPKKGRKSWAPVEMLRVHKMEPGYRYRWANRDDNNIERLEAEGWDVVNATTSRARRTDARSTDDGAPLSTVKQYRELLLVRMDEETAEERNVYFSEQSSKLMNGVKEKAAENLRQSGASVRGDITIIR